MKYINDISNFIFLSNDLKTSDIIFIPGGSSPEIAETAAKLWLEGYAPLILPSGKYSTKRGYFLAPSSKGHIYNKTYNTEWQFLRDVLITNGVDEKVILKEDNATFTYENAIFSKNVTDNLNLNIKSAIICCKAFHARRCLMYYETLFPNTEFIICPTVTNDLSKESWFKTEQGINIVLGEIERCGWQFKDILKNMIK